MPSLLLPRAWCGLRGRTTCVPPPQSSPSLGLRCLLGVEIGEAQNDRPSGLLYMWGNRGLQQADTGSRGDRRAGTEAMAGDGCRPRPQQLSSLGTRLRFGVTQSHCCPLCSLLPRSCSMGVRVRKGLSCAGWGAAAWASEPHGHKSEPVPATSCQRDLICEVTTITVTPWELVDGR